ncbi:MAG: hypothetical protein D6679_00160 [Candidatus Hydrogenedentota bacterium]|nr:MAG: hypothetical protein D6679_00160 [Candidatus Hydrogenedentota bacterium]
MKISTVSVSVPVSGLQRRVSIGFASDFHIRRKKEIPAIIEALERLDTDCLLLGGDYCEEADLVEPFFAEVTELKRRAFAVWGNNDLPFERELLRAGRRWREDDPEEGRVCWLFDDLLRREGYFLAGLSHLKRPDLPENRLVFSQRPLLILAHTPDAILRLSKTEDVTLLAGHSHGGQVRLPFVPWWWSHTKLGYRHGEGLSRRGRNVLFVGRGIGCSMFEIRNVPREVYRITLVPEGEWERDGKGDGGGS